MQAFTKASTLKRINRLLEDIKYTKDKDLIIIKIVKMREEIHLWEE